MLNKMPRNQAQLPTEPSTRELTVLEYVILGFLGIKPQSGYDIIGNFEIGIYRTSASTGSIYPVLKRLEKLELITSTLEAVHETRPRKVYALRPAGERLLDDWLRRSPTLSEIIEDFDIAMHKFLVAEYRLSRSEVLEWLDAYEQVVTLSQQLGGAIYQATQGGGLSLHAGLVNYSIKLEIQARLTWIKAAQSRLREE